MFGAQRHAPRSLFRRVSKVHNNGRELTFIKPSDCRMGGQCIALLRVLRLKEPLDECFASKVFLDLGNRFTPLRDVVKVEEFWDLLYAVCQLLMPLYMLLRLADKRLGAMDKVKYYVLQVDRLLEDSCDNVVDKMKKSNFVKICALSNYALPGVKEAEKDAKLKTEGLNDDEYGKFYLC